MRSTILLAGRRPDTEGADFRRFPIENAICVRERIRALFAERDPANLVCSAACGADLLALDVAGDLGVRRHVVLPFAVNVFRELSVIDRPGRWGKLFDRVLGDIVTEGRLTILGEELKADGAFEAANRILLQTATALGAPLIMVPVWEGAPHGENDITADLLDAARSSGAETHPVLTI